MIECIFDCLTVAYNFMQKSSRIAEIPTKVVGGYFFNVHPVYGLSYGVESISISRTVYRRDRLTSVRDGWTHVQTYRDGRTLR